MTTISSIIWNICFLLELCDFEFDNTVKTWQIYNTSFKNNNINKITLFLLTVHQVQSSAIAEVYD